MDRKKRFHAQLALLIAAVKEEQQAAARQDSRYTAAQLHYILEELTSMGRAVAWEEPFQPSYPRLIADMWPPDDGLGHELSKLANDYFKVQMERKLRPGPVKRMIRKLRRKRHDDL